MPFARIQIQPYGGILLFGHVDTRSLWFERLAKVGVIETGVDIHFFPGEHLVPPGRAQMRRFAEASKTYDTVYYHLSALQSAGAGSTLTA